MAKPAGDAAVGSRSGELFLPSVSSSATSPAPSAASAPASVSLLSLNGEAPLIRGLSLREHYKLDWHRFNLKQRLKNKPLLSASDFEQQSSTGDLSSISGSDDTDSSSEEDLLPLDEGRAESEKPNRPPGFYPHRVLFKNAQGQFLYAYRCVLGPHQASNSPDCVLTPNFCILGFPQPMYVLFSSF